MIAFSAVAAVLAVAAGPHWSAPVQISSSERALGPELAMNAAGDALVVWDQEVGADCPTTPASLACIHIVTAAERASPTSPWGAPIELNRPGVGSRPRPAIDANGDAAVIWVHDVGVDRVLQATYRRGTAGHWPEPNDLSDYVLGVTNHGVALDAIGNAFVSWAERTDSVVVVRHQRRSAVSGVWEGPKRLSDRVIGGPALALAVPGTAETAWAEPGQIVEADIPDFGYRIAVLPTAGTAPTGDVDIATTAVVFAAAGPSGALIEGALCCNFTYTWPTTKVIGEARDSVSARPKVAMNGISTIAIWVGAKGVQAADGNTVSGTWSSPVTLALDAAATDPQIAIDPAGNAVAVWISGTGTVRAAIRPAATRAWQPAVTLSAAGESSPRVAMDAAGNAVAVWNRASGDSAGVESSQLSATGPVVERVVVPKRARVRRRVVFDVYTAPWASPLAGSPVWRFGDGKGATGRRVTHAYGRAGRYNVSVTQADASGGASTANATIKIARRRVASGR